MNSRMDKYKKSDFNEEDIPKRSDKHKELYRQIYNAYDEFENLVVPSNSKEIDLNDLDKVINSRSDYHEQKQYEDIVRTNNNVIKREKAIEKQKKENEVYDIKELLNKAVNEKKEQDGEVKKNMSQEDYLKKLNLDNRKTNASKMKEMYEEMYEEAKEEKMDNDVALLETANLSLEILSDLKGDNEQTCINPPIKEEELPDDLRDEDFYSNKYHFSKSDFEDREVLDNLLDISDDYIGKSKNRGKYFLKVLSLIFGILLVIIIIIYIFNYFNRV